MSRHIRLDDLVGRVVRDEKGQVVGRIYDIRAEESNGALEIVEYHIGSAALLERVGVSLAHLVGIERPTAPRKVPWDQLDVSDPDNPKLIA